MIGFYLTIPAWYNHEAKTNVDEKTVHMFLPYPPFEGLQIEVPDDGIVTVTAVRVLPMWRTDGPHGLRALDIVPRTEVYTNWARRPNGAKVLSHG